MPAMMDNLNESIVTPMPPSWTDFVYAEGYLKKIRGFAQNRTRDIVELRDVSSDEFEVITKIPFGASGSCRMLLEAKNATVKTRWLSALRKPLTQRVQEENLVVEGYLKKIQPFGTGFSRTRWFTLTNLSLTYYEEEEGPELASILVGDIDHVVEAGSDTFVITGKHAFSKSGSSVLTCRAEDTVVRDKWLSAFRRVNNFRDLRPTTDHYARLGTATKRAPDEPIEFSEGNRFIRNNDL